jgi:dTDP-4-amino-4,6-dideoxygalactose transaminase
METEAIPVFQPSIGADTLAAVSNAFEIGWLGMGATTRRFEQALQTYLDTDRHVVATMTGSAALHLGLLLAGVGPGDEVILPSFNFIADLQAVLWCGATPVFCDIDEPSLGLDPSCLADLLTPRTRAVIPLHFAGIVADLDDILILAEAHQLRVVEDATHALGSYRGTPRRAVGAAGDIACFSFDPVKIITSIDGGAVTCRADDDAALLHRLRLLGIEKDTEERYRNRRAWEYDVSAPGYRAHMTNINAAIGLSQIARLDEFLAHRRRDCRAYNEAFADLDWLSTPRTDFADVGPFIYTVRVHGGRRAEFIAHLRERGVAAGIHFLPLHEKALCRAFPRGPLPVTERIGREIVTLPLWSNMPGEVHARVIDAVRTFAPAPVGAC